MTSKPRMGDSLYAESLPEKQRRAIYIAKIRGKKLADQHPEIAEYYRSGLSYSQIEKKFELSDLTEDIARNATKVAVSILITKEERAQIREQFLQEKKARGGSATHAKGVGIFQLSPEEMRAAGIKGGKKAGALTRDKGIGLFGMSSEEKIAASIKGGKKAGALTRDKGIGLFGRSPEKRKEDARHAGRLRALAIGRLPWITHLVEPETGLNEIEYLMCLLQKPEFLHPENGRYGSGNGKANTAKIAEELNRAFHDGVVIRTPAAIRNYAYRMRKKAKQALEDK